MTLLDKLPAEMWLGLNGKLQQKKSQLRKQLTSKGVIRADKRNNGQNYSYLSEAGYKELLSPLLMECGLELTSSMVDVSSFDGSQNMRQGRRAAWEFTLTDIDTGFCEKSVVYGEGVDGLDKAIYKASTGAMKYYFANTFLVATGNDAEATEVSIAKQVTQFATPEQVEMIQQAFTPDQIKKSLAKNRIASLNELPYTKALGIIEKINQSEVRTQA